MTIELLDGDKNGLCSGRALRMTDMEEEELNNRISKAWAKFSIYKDELRDCHILPQHRLRLFDPFVSPTILYGSGTWVTTTDRRRQLRMTQRKMLRSMLNVRRMYTDDRGNVQDYIEWIQRAIQEVEQTANAYGLDDWAEQQQKRVLGGEMGGESCKTQR